MVLVLYANEWKNDEGGIPVTEYEGIKRCSHSKFMVEFSKDKTKPFLVVYDEDGDEENDGFYMLGPNRKVKTTYFSVSFTFFITGLYCFMATKNNPIHSLH